MAELTSSTNVVGSVVGAVLGGTVLVALAPVILPAVVFGGAAAAVTVGVGTVIGGAIGYFSTKPSEDTIVQLLSSPKIQGLLAARRR